MKTIAFFNNKGGVGKTSLVYHLSYLFADKGLRVLAVDLDPQANLSSIFLKENRLEELWPDGDHPATILGVIQPILKGTGDIASPSVENITENLGLLPGDLGLASFEDKLSLAWPQCQNRDESSLRSMTAFHRAILNASVKHDADLALIDVGPNLGPINRAAIIAAEHIVIPLSPDLFSLQGVKNLGPTLRRWRQIWSEIIAKFPDSDLPLPGGKMIPLGYVVLQHSERLNRPVKAFARWMNRIPAAYRKDILDEAVRNPPEVAVDPFCLSMLKHYRSLMPMAMDANKPIFQLKPSDGAIGAHAAAVKACYSDFEKLASNIAEKCGISLPQ